MYTHIRNQHPTQNTEHFCHSGKFLHVSGCFLVAFLLLISNLIKFRAEYVVFVSLNLRYFLLRFAFRSSVVHPASYLPKLHLLPYNGTQGFIPIGNVHCEKTSISQSWQLGEAMSPSSGQCEKLLDVTPGNDVGKKWCHLARPSSCRLYRQTRGALL